MQIVVTGASSPLGQSLLRGLAAKGSLSGADGPAPIRRILAVDRAQGPALFLDDRIEYVRGAFEQPRFLARMMGTTTDGIFHLAALDPGPEDGEDPAADLDSDLTQTWDGTRALLDACRFQTAQPKVVIASTVEATGESGCEAPRSRAGALAAFPLVGLGTDMGLTASVLYGFVSVVLGLLAAPAFAIGRYRADG